MENINEIQQPFSAPKYYRYYKYTKGQMVALINTLSYHMNNVEQEICKLKSLISDFNDNYKKFEELDDLLMRYQYSFNLRSIGGFLQDILVNLQTVKRFYDCISRKKEEELYINQYLIRRVAIELNNMYKVVDEPGKAKICLSNVFPLDIDLIGEIILGIHIDKHGFIEYEECLVNDNDIIVNGKIIPKSRLINQEFNIINSVDEIERSLPKHSKISISIIETSNPLIITDNMEIIADFARKHNRKIYYIARHETCSAEYNSVSSILLKGLPMRAIFDHTDITEVNKVLSTEYCSQPCYKSSLEDIKVILDIFVFVDRDNNTGKYQFYICEIH